MHIKNSKFYEPQHFFVIFKLVFSNYWKQINKNKTYLNNSYIPKAD